MTQVPRFALPLRYVNGSAVVNEQSSLEDIACGVYAVAVTNPGDRQDMQDFGLNDMTFSQEPISTAAAEAQIEEWEPRAAVLIDADPDKYDMALVNASVNVEVAS